LGDSRLALDEHHITRAGMFLELSILFGMRRW
jgi:hypothetical protein